MRNLTRRVRDVRLRWRRPRPLPALAALVALTASLLPPLVLAPATAAETYALLVSAAPDRSAPGPLEGTTHSGKIYVFTSPDAGVNRVRFYLDDTAMTGTPRQVEKRAPFDFAGTASDGTARPFDTTGVTAGSHVITAALDLGDGTTTVLSATFSIEHDTTTSPSSPYELLVSTAADRSSPVPLEGTTQDGDMYVFTSPDTDVARVRFYLDDPTMAGTPIHKEGRAPFDFAGTAKSGAALPYDTTQLTGGSHTITAALEKADGSVSAISATFTVPAPDVQPALKVDRSAVAFTGVAGGEPVKAAVKLSTNDGSSTAYTWSATATWLSVAPDTGSTPLDLDVVADPAQLSAGTHTGTVTFDAQDYDPVSVEVTLTVQATSGDPYDVVMSTSKDRSSPVPLDGRNVTGAIYAFLAPETDVTSTSWWLDDIKMAGTPWRTDTAAPYDFMPGSDASTPVAFDTATVPDGAHTITVAVSTAAGTTVVSTASFVTENDTNSLTWTPDEQNIEVDPGTAAPVTVDMQLSSTKPGTVAQLSGGAPYVTYEATQVQTPASVPMTVDPTGLASGQYTFEVTASAEGAFDDVLPIHVTVGESDGCSPVACEDIRVNQPYVLPFDGDQGLMPDKNGTGTGFTTLLQDDGGEYVRKDLELDAAASVMRITARPKSFGGTENAQENAIGIGFNGGEVNVVTTTLTNLPKLTGRYEQAGLWFGYDQDNVNKLDLVSTPDGPRVEQILEVGGSEAARKRGGLLNLVAGDVVGLSVQADPVTRTLTGSYRVNNGAWVKVASFDAPGEFFSADAAGIDPLIGTRTFAGIYATSRKATTTPVFQFDDFTLTGTPARAGSDYAFDRKSHPVSFPTSLAFGPDGRLYVTTLSGDIHVLTYDDTHTVTNDKLVTTLGERLALGMAIDPASTAENVTVWVAHSSPSLSQGEADSGVVTRLSGPDLGTREDVITGLPRSIANHGPNSLHFGPDGRLYMAIGGNTGAGAPNDADTEFGDRGEQPLSAALLVADPKAAGFDGTCADPTDIYASDDCDVTVFSSGLRNTYDFTFHSNGHIYGPDNGLGVVGSYPPTPEPPCTGLGSTVSYENGGHNPGEQPDELNLLEQGRYYGHPDPARDECVFGDGSYQNVAPLPNYTPPMYDLGKSRSANGIIEYRGDAFCGTLNGNLLLTNYSVGDDVVSLTLSADGRSVLAARSIVGGLSDPLPLVQAPDGTLLVGEFADGKVTTLLPRDTGCWSESVPLPEALLDAGGTAIGDDIYIVGGKTSAGPQTTVYVYDTATQTWATAPDVPGEAVENPATVAVDGKLHVFGGSTGPFSGAVARSAVFDPASGSWTALPDLPTPRGGPAAVHLDGTIYVLGGMTGDGASSPVVEAFDIATGTWSTLPDMATARDNPGAAALDGSVYVFGGRTRLADGSTVNGALASVESFDPAGNSWTSRAPMPTGRRTMVSAVLNGQAVLVGGEGGGTDAFDATESYDPATDTWSKLWPMSTPRHGAAGGVVDGRLHVLGGGPKTGSSFTTKHEVFRPPA